MAGAMADRTRNGRRGSFHAVNDAQQPLVSAWGELIRHPYLQRMLDWMKLRTRRAKPWCLRTIDRGAFQAIMFFITVYALIGDDVRLAATRRPADFWFNIATIVALLLFTFELVASCIGKEDYFLSFFFWLDLVATVSLILDITWIFSLFTGSDSSLARAGRMSRVGTRAGRVIRIIRLIRLIRIIKLYKHVFDFWKRVRKDDDSPKPGDGTDEEVYAESRVGQKLSHMTTQKVIVLILFMLIMLPIISVEEFFRDLPTSSQYGADVVYRAYSKCKSGSTTSGDHSMSSNSSDNATSVSCQIFEQQLTMYIGYHHRQQQGSCESGWSQAFHTECKLDLGWIGFHAESGFAGFKQKPIDGHWDYLFSGAAAAPGPLYSDFKLDMDLGHLRICEEGEPEYRYTSMLSDEDIGCPEDLRFEERNPVAPRLVDLNEIPSIIFVFDLRPWMLRSAVYNIIQTVFICAILAVGAMVFSHDANVLVLQPIERMISKVEKIRDNPLYAMKLGDETYREKQEQEKEPASPRRQDQHRRCRCWHRRRDVKVQTLETKILENAIIKLGKLLALGFGEAGSEIIGKNMDDDGATVNAMIPGNKVYAVFGFCDIRNFTDTTEVLQDKVMVFVNQVAEIVHNIVDTWHGAANRNIGDAFLIVWRMCEDFTKADRTKVGDMSVISFVQVVAAINKSWVLKDYREHPALLARLPNYRVRMGFGLHYGWAIEGAIGSEFKIDASYLSPHVNMASRLEAVTKQYQVLILMSEPLAKLCSPDMVRYFRTIDHVTLKGGMSTPIRLHTVDLNGDTLKPDYVVPKRGKNQFELRLQREKAKEEKMQESFQVHTLFEKDPDLRKMRKEYPTRFFQLFSKGYLNYEAGEWNVARTVLETTRDMLSGKDGPSQALLDFMAQFEFDSARVTPKGWPHYRELIEI
mmetsp:Transcript_8444/g.26258  ORF Transcript_8444/g.26258 Transcript_8444/m.26258 type:complete len:919 (-) Transcript_8444:232-2988(-)